MGATIGLAVIGAVAIVPPKWPPPPPAPPPPAASAFGAKAKLSAQAPARSVSLLEIVRGMVDFSFYGSIVCPAPSIVVDMETCALARGFRKFPGEFAKPAETPAFSKVKNLFGKKRRSRNRERSRLLPRAAGWEGAARTISASAPCRRRR
jgi:hypothetical protein